MFKRLKAMWAGKPDLSAEYYQREHEQSSGYRSNNWMLAEQDRLLSCNPRSLLEIGFGNARFLRQVAPMVETAIGLDWAISPLAIDLPENVTVRRADVVQEELPKADLVCSADVLEHFKPTDIPNILGKMHAAGRFNYHVIACFQTSNHLSVFPPDVWLQKFQTMAPSYRLVEVYARQDGRKPACVIANY